MPRASSTLAACASASRSNSSTDIVPGDYVIVHVGYALQRLDPDEAARTLALFAEAGAANDGPAAEAA